MSEEIEITYCSRWDLMDRKAKIQFLFILVFIIPPLQFGLIFLIETQFNGKHFCTDNWKKNAFMCDNPTEGGEK